MRTAAILPVKRFSAAKQRLGESVAESLRAELARAMVGDVLSALRDCPAIDTTIVVTCEPGVAAAARYVGAIVVKDSAESGQSAAVSIGLRRALEDGFERCLCIPGDCPALDPQELDALLGLPRHTDEHGQVATSAAASPAGDDGAGNDLCRRGEGGAATSSQSGARARTHAHARVSRPGEVVIVPDRHGTGTNGLLLTPPDAIDPSFGTDSRTRHERLARSAGVACRVERLPSLLLDVDTGDDLDALLERLVGERVRAPRTRAVLERSGAQPPVPHAA
jgi:2-phospho-L-lactate/phosphoenolpyruvate guanylyltransferase